MHAGKAPASLARLPRDCHHRYSTGKERGDLFLMEPDDRLVSLLREAQSILFFTGAGISTGSGIPDFRGP